MSDYLRYYLSPLILAASVYGLYLGGAYVWISLASLPILAIGVPFCRAISPHVIFGIMGWR